MKKKMLIAAAVALTACVVALAQSEVLSQNAVGYVKKSVPSAGGLAIIGHPLNSMETANIIFTNTSIAGEMPMGSKAFFWSGTSWQSSEKKTKGWSDAGVGKTVAVGESFFLQTPSTQAVPVAVTIAGEVPDDLTLPVTITGASNLVAVANPYPIDIVFTNTSLASNLVQGSKAFFWSGVSWQSSEKKAKGWSDAGVGKNLAAGEGFFVQTPDPAGLTWNETKPYTWP